MKAAKQKLPTVLVTDARRGSAVAIIRSLGRRGWRVIAADSDPFSPGLRSRYASERVLYPNPEVAPREFVATLLATIRNKQVDLLIPVTDAVILPLLGARAEFEASCQLALPDAAALAVTMNKSETLALAQRLHVPLPRTYLANTVHEALEQAPHLGWPLVVKPQASRLYREKVGTVAFEVSYAAGIDELTEQMRRYEGICAVLLQEYCRGVGEGVELLLYQGQPLAAFQHRRLREVPITGGASTLRESVPLDPVLFDHAVRLLSELQWTGLAMVEFKSGREGPKLMEINGRVWGSLPLAVFSGMDFPARLAELYLCGPRQLGAGPDLAYKAGVRARNLELDIGWIISVLYGKRRYPFFTMPGRREGVRALLGMFNPSTKFDILSLADPGPGLVEIAKIARKLYGKSKARVALSRHEEWSIETYAGSSRQ